MNSNEDSREEEQSLAERGSNRSQRPTSASFQNFMTSGWAEPANSTGADAEHNASELAAQFLAAAARRKKLAEVFPTDRLVIPAGTLKVRSNDTDYRFRPHSAFSHLTGTGGEQEPDAVLVITPSSETADESSSILFVNPPSGRSGAEFYADAQYGEFWVGARPSLVAISAETGMETKPLAELADFLAKDLGSGAVQLRVVAQADNAVSNLVAQARKAAGLTDELGNSKLDDELSQAVSELRLIKDDYEISQLQLAVNETIAGFEKVGRSLKAATKLPAGERLIETTFDAHARLVGNTVGYETIAAAGNHATILHWIRNNGVVKEGELVLVDAGVEVDSLYTADVTRTLPVSGTFSPVQAEIYDAVLAAADAAFAVAVPGRKFAEVHQAAISVIAQALGDWGLLPVSVEESLNGDGQFHRRWMVHGTSHHLGLDVHDCAQARKEMYLDAVIEPGMVFTIEPGLYFKSDDLKVPEEFRGIGVRIEDDVLVTPDGNKNLSAALPRTRVAIEAWLANLATISG